MESCVSARARAYGRSIHLDPAPRLHPLIALELLGRRERIHRSQLHDGRGGAVSLSVLTYVPSLAIGK